MKEPTIRAIEREKDVRFIQTYFRTHAEADGPVVFLIHGQPLSGKTTLATSVIQWYAEHGVHDILTLNGVEEGTTYNTPQEGIPATLSEALAQRLRRSKTHSSHPQELRVVLDHHEDSAVLQAIVERFAGCRAYFLVTARNPHLGLKELFTEDNRLYLPPFDQEEARTLLRKRLPDAEVYPDTQLAQLNQWVGGNPGALNTIVHHLAAQPDVQWEDFQQQLLDNDKQWLFDHPIRWLRKRTAVMPFTVEEAFSAGINGLSELARKVLLHSAFLQPKTPLDPRLLVTVFDEEYSRTRIANALRELAVLGLVQPLEEGLFQLHRLSADYTRRLAEEDRRTILTCVAQALLKEVGCVEETGFQKRFDPLAVHVQEAADLAESSGVDEDTRDALWLRLAAYQSEQEQWEDVLRSLERRLAIADARIPTPENQRLRLNLLTALIETHEQLANTDALQAALADLEALCDRLAPRRSNRRMTPAEQEMALFVARMQQWAGQRRLAFQQWDQAQAHFQHAKTALRQGALPHGDVVAAAEGEARVHAQQGGSSTLAREAFVQLEKEIAASPMPVLSPVQLETKRRICLQQGQAMQEAGKLRQARKYYEEAYDAIAGTLGREAPPFRQVAWMLAELDLRQQRWRDAVDRFTELKEGTAENRNALHQEQVDACLGLGISQIGANADRGTLESFESARKADKAHLSSEAGNRGLINAGSGAGWLLLKDFNQAAVYLRAAVKELRLAYDREVAQGWLNQAETAQLRLQQGKRPARIQRKEVVSALVRMFQRKVANKYREPGD